MDAAGGSTAGAGHAFGSPLMPVFSRRTLLPVLLCIAAFVVFAVAARHHPIGTYWTETDFYHLYGPDAARIAAGQFPENPYQGPGFPALVAILAKFTGDTFIAGKWISVVCATLVVGLTFLLFSRLFGYWIGLAAAALVPVSVQFVQFAISSTTDILFLLLALGCLVALLDERLGIRLRTGLAGVLAGLAYLVRYNGLFLVATALAGILLFNLFSVEWRRRISLSVIFVAVLLVTASPWLYLNYRHRGSPLYNTNYLNMATEFYPELAEGQTNQDGTRGLESVFHSFGDVLRYDPARILRHYPANLYSSLRDTITTDLVSQLTGWLAVIGVLIVLATRRSKAALTFLLAMLVYLLLMGLNHWETRYYFFTMVGYCGLAVFAIATLWGWVRERFALSNRALALVPVIVFAFMWTSSFVMARKDIEGFLANHPMEVVAACDYLRSKGVTGARIVARKPHLPAICGQEWVFFPPVKSLDELHAWLLANRVDYLVISSVEVKRRKELAALKSPSTAPSWLESAWESKNPFLILYRPKL